MHGDFVVSSAGCFYGQWWCVLPDGVEAGELAGGEELEGLLAALAVLRPNASVAPAAAAARAVPMRDFGIFTLISLSPGPVASAAIGRRLS
jgi:hypothetical protein